MSGDFLWGTSKKVISVTLISILLYLGLRYLLPVFVPFIVAFLVSALIRPAASFCRRHLRIGAKLASVVLILSVFSLLTYGVYLLGLALIRETGDFIVTLSETAGDSDSPIFRITHMVDGIGEKLPLADVGGVDFANVTNELIKTGTEKVTVMATNGAAKIISALPSAILTFGVSLIALVYLTVDYDGAAKAIKEFLPRDTADKAVRLYHRLTGALGEYFRAYFLLMLITFGELYLGLVILRVEYALLFAAIIAVVDFLPILGVGTVLLPWGAGALLLGNYRLGAGIFILYAVIGVVRQFVEPRLMGNFIGTHPFVALVGVYAGLRLFGIVGMIAAPVILYLVKTLRTGEKEKSRGK